MLSARVGNGLHEIPTMIDCQCGDNSILVGTGIYAVEFTPGDLDLCHSTSCSLFDFAETHGPVFNERPMCCQCYNHSHTSVMPIDGNRLIIEDSIHKSRHLSNKTFGIAFQEEMKGQITSDAVSIADDSCIGVIVFGGDCSCAAQQFHALVIAIDGMAAVTDRTDDVVGKAQCDNSIFCIACRSDNRVPDDVCLTKNFLDFTSNQVTGHIEIMDHHIEKNAA